MNILHINEQIGIKGGTEVYVLALYKLLPLQGHKVFWIGLNEDISGAFQLTIFGDDSEKKDISISEAKQFLKNYLEKNSIELIHIHNFFSPSILEFLFSLRPMICTPHTPWVVCPGRDKFWRKSERICTKAYGLHCFQHIYTEQCGNRHPLRVWKAWKNVEYVVKTASKKYKAIMVMSDYVKNECVKGGIAENKVVLNPCFTLMSPSDSLGSNKKKHILFVGRLISSKGVHLLVSALSSLLKKYPEVVLDIVGDGGMMTQIQAQIENNDLVSNVVLHGWKAKEVVDKMISEAYLVAFPSIYPEAFGLVGIEAMMCAKPVVAFEVGGVSTWLKDGKTGFLVENKNEKALSEAIEKLILDENLAKEMGKNGQKYALENFTPEVHIQKLIGIYQKAIGKL